MKVASGATVRFALLQFAAISSFFSIVYMDRFVLDVVLTPLNAMRHVREFHFAFFDILSTVIFASIAIAYLIGGTRREPAVALPPEAFTFIWRRTHSVRLRLVRDGTFGDR
jgi:hypothetical protein